MANLLGPNILITGTNRGIGLGLVKELAKREGVHRIFAGYYSKISYTELKEFEEQCSKVHAIELDVDCDESIKSAFDEVYESLGENSGLNLLVNDAAILEKDNATVQNPHREVCLRHFNVNTMGAIMTTATFLPLLKKAASLKQQSVVVNISSTNGSVELGSGTSFVSDDGHFKNIAYGMSKCAINHYTKALATEETGIIAIAICPGWVRTKMRSSKATKSVEECALSLADRISKLTKNDSGSFMNVYETLPY